METVKQKKLDTLRAHIKNIQEKILEYIDAVKMSANKSLKEIGSMQPSDQLVYMQLKAYAVDRKEQLERLYGSPYFIKCEVIENETQEKKEYYFAKHQLIEESVYSWVAPIASIRFESLGPITYLLPNGEVKKMTLVHKEQYMIVDGKVMFFSEENQNKPRELIYQEHFTKQKSEFVLPEIVAQMEKAQDTVIRADYKGPLVISGPAGSGKTTLALHRVAYLTQAPDTTTLYPTESIIVFVQDRGTKEYFSQLLPGLGIHNVQITTFFEWAMNILGLHDYYYENRLGDSEEEKDIYEYQKIQALRSVIPEYKKDPMDTLMRGYKNFFSKKSQKIFRYQKIEKKLDRFDLTILLRSYIQRYEKFETVRRYESVVKGVLRKKIQKNSILYTLMIVDEFQNYLPEQLLVMKKCLDERMQSVIYVGDMAQQVYLGTLRKWDDINEQVKPERNIRLDKVYRNTKNILRYIQSLGYQIGIPEGIKDGPKVVEKICSTEQEIEHIKKMLDAYKDGTIGIIAKDTEYLGRFRNEFREQQNVHILTMNESQGVEFDFVCIVGLHQGTFTVVAHQGVLSEHLDERKKMQKDLLYVALTRAITELHILGTHMPDPLLFH